MSGVKGTVLHRLKIARGHIQGIVLMIDRGEYCVGVSQQIHAVRGTLRKVDMILLKEHLKNGGSLLETLKVFKNKNRVCL